MGVGVVKTGEELGGGAAGSLPTVLLSLGPSTAAEGGTGKRVSG